MNALDTEILVHITAPSRATDDTQYRALAKAYMEFEPTTRTIFYPDRGRSGPHGREIEPPTRLPGSLQSPALSFDSVWDNVRSPRLTRGRLGGGQSQDKPASQSQAPPPSVVADSQPDNDISIAAFCSPTRTLEHYLQNISTPSDPSQELPGQGRSLRNREPGSSLGRSSGSHSQPSSLELHPTPSQSSPPHDDIIPSSLDHGVDPSRPADTGSQPQSSIAIFTPDPISLPRKRVAECQPDSRPSPRIAVTEPEPIQGKRRRISLEGDDLQVLARSSVDDSLRRAEQATGNRELYAQEGWETADRLEVHPPDPPVACEEITQKSLVTKAFVELERDLDFSRRYRPRRQAREVRPFERGYWLLDTSDYDEELKEAAWAFLRDYITKGQAGWSVWCKRDASRNWIRAYCFGSIAGYVFLALYLCSQRELKRTGATWYDGDGKPTIVVESRRSSG